MDPFSLLDNVVFLYIFYAYSEVFIACCYRVILALVFLFKKANFNTGLSLSFRTDSSNNLIFLNNSFLKTAKGLHKMSS